MRTPNVHTDTGQPSIVPEAVGGDDGRLTEIDTILAEMTRRDTTSAAAAASKRDDQESFLASFAAVCREEVRPAMEAVLERLTRGGGGGLIEERPGGEARFTTPRLTFWMSLQGELLGIGRPDRHPYLQLDADVSKREVQVSEGDMWNGAGGGHSGRTGEWAVDEITKDRIIEELLVILRRSAPGPARDRPTG